MKRLFTLLLIACIAVTAVFADDSNISLTVKASVKDAVVSINAKSYGTAPLTVTDLEPGFYIITVEKKGWYPWRSDIALNKGDEITLYAELEQITGTVLIDCAVSNPTIYVDGSLYAKDNDDDITFMDVLESLMYKDLIVLKVPEGFHTITLSKFGYEDWTTEVAVLRKTVQQTTAQMERAPFSASGFPKNTPRFNPKNPGGLGSVTIPFTVTAEGTAEIEIYNPWGDLIDTKYIGPFKTWSNSFTWNGQTGPWGADFIEDGYYLLRFTFYSTPNEIFDEQIITYETYVEIDSSITYQITSLNETGLSAGAVPLALMSPGKSGYLDFASGVISSPDESVPVLVPFTLGFEYTINPTTSITVHNTLYADFTKEEGNNVSTWAVSGAIRKQVLDGPVTTALALRYQYVYGDSTVGLYDRNAGIAAEVAAGTTLTRCLYAGLSTGIIYGDGNGLFATPSLRTRTGLALNLQLGNFATDLYGLMYTSPSSGLFTPDGMETGCTLHYIPSNSPAFLNLGGRLYFRPDEQTQGSITAGLSVFM